MSSIIFISSDTPMSQYNSGDNTQMINEYLRSWLREEPNVSEINLELKTIPDLLPFIHLLTEFKNLQRLSLHGNRLRELPTDLSMLKKLEYLDISNNLFDDNVQLVVSSLKTLPNLKNLIFQVPPEKEQMIVEEIKTLEYFNNIKIERKKAKKAFVYNLVNPKTMGEYEDKMANLFKECLHYEEKYLNEKPEQHAVEKFREDIRAISKDSLERLHRFDEQASHSLEYVTLYMTRYQMFDELKNKALHLTQDIYSELGDFIFKINQEQDELFNNLAEKALNLTQLQNEFKIKQEEEKRHAEGTPDYLVLNKNMAMQKEIKRLKKQKDEILSETNHVESLNKKLLEALSKYSKNEKSLNNANLSHLKELTKTTRLMDNENSSQFSAINRNIPLPPTIRSNQTNNDKHLSTPHQNRTHHNFHSNSSGHRNLTLKALKDTIDEIYEAKLKFDQKNYDGRIARETMHQYLFTHLNQKYGLKSLTIEAAASIVSGIQSYSPEDNDVCVFGKILRNEIDEEFRFVQSELKSTVNDLLKMHIKTKMPYKSTNEINEILNEKLSHDITWEEAEDIVKYLYNKDDSNKIIRKLDVLFKVNERHQTPQERNPRRLTREEQASLQSQKHVRRVRFSQFLKCVLDFQLRNHEKLLQPLVRTFKVRDGDSDGIINEEEFIFIVQELCIEANDIIPYLLNVVDPYETKQITFTQMVRLVANYPESNPILSRFVSKEDNEDQYLSDHND